MDLTRPDVAAILARKRILNDIKRMGCVSLTAQTISQVFNDWPTEHIDYFCNVHNLVMYATMNGVIKIRLLTRSS